MNAESFAGYLAGLDEDALTALLQARPDVRVEPVPRSFVQLAQRLSNENSLAGPLQRVNRDAVVAGQVVAALGPAATVPNLARLLGASEAAVRRALAELCGRGLAWTDAGVVYLPQRLAEHWSVGIGGRPVSVIAHTAYADDLRTAAEALGVEVAGLRKPELIAQLTETMSNSRAMARILAELSEPAQDRLDLHRHGHANLFSGFGRLAGPDPDQALGEAGLLLRVQSRWELPREVALAAWLAEPEHVLTGPPAIPRAGTEPAAQRATAQAAVAAMLHAMTSLLDEARDKPITALKKGGVGPRERTRLATRLSLSADVVMLCIDLAYAAGLLGEVAAGYAPTGAYADWRAAQPSRQWATLAVAWFTLEHASTHREIEEGKELPPPLPLGSSAGPMRRALLIAAGGGESVSTTGERIDWFFPLHGYDEPRREAKTAAAIREAELMGVIAGDQITECGQHLVSVACADDADNLVEELARLAAPLLPEQPCTVILQSDLTAVVSGQPTVAVSRVLTAAAVSEARATAGVWRFTPASVRGALDAGWTAQALLAELAAITDHALPQPLEYLITDMARRHGTVRVRGMRSCVLADETTIVELLHTRALGTLHLAQLAPTVLSSPFELDRVLSALRAAGLSPVAEDALGVVIVEERTEHQAPQTPPTPSQTRLTAAELAERLAADPNGKLDSDADSSTFELLAQFGSHLDDAELRLLCHAVDNQHDVRITYRDNNGSRTVRQIQPRQVYGRWLDSWCHLRNAQRDFTITNILAVSPAG